MSCSKPVPPFIFDSLYYLNRDQLERFSIVSRPLKNFIERYFRSKPYRVFDQLLIRRGSYVLRHNHVQWHPNREDYCAQQFLNGEECSIDYRNIITYYSFAKMRPYFAPSVRMKCTVISVAADSTYNPEDIGEMESISYLWHDGDIHIWHAEGYGHGIRAKDFLPILNSPIILQCRLLEMDNAVFSFKDYKILYTVNIIDVTYSCEDVNLNYWQEFLEQPGLKPVVAFSSAVLPNAFKIVFRQDDVPLTEFRVTNKISGEKFELKKGTLVDYQGHSSMSGVYTLERSCI